MKASAVVRTTVIEVTCKEQIGVELEKVVKIPRFGANW